jgi:hypothetical protein
MGPSAWAGGRGDTFNRLGDDAWHAETVIEGMEWLGQWIQRRMVQWHLNLMWRGQYQWEVHTPLFNYNIDYN